MTDIPDIVERLRVLRLLLGAELPLLAIAEIERLRAENKRVLSINADHAALAVRDRDRLDAAEARIAALTPPDGKIAVWLVEKEVRFTNPSLAALPRGIRRACVDAIARLDQKEAIICSIHKRFYNTDHEMGTHDEPNT
jgi:hypothetical protein